MVNPSVCNGYHGIGLMDYAYLALNVYHDPNDTKTLGGTRPQKILGSTGLVHTVRTGKGWYQMDIPGYNLIQSSSFYADFYVKIYNGKIHHLMVAFRGTFNRNNKLVDAETWWPATLPGTDHGLPTVGYWSQAVGFICNCSHLIREMDRHHLLTHFCGHHMTGHSLGGALANLVAAKALICQPANMHSQLPMTPDVISFNAPGVANMPGVCESTFCEGRVISMRAEYDAVSAIGEPYGYVVNNALPEAEASSKEAFDIQHQQESFEKWSGLLSGQPVMGSTLSPVLVKAYEAVQRAREGYEAKDIMQQHSMNNFLKMIKTHNKSIEKSFYRIKNWAREHGGKNHDLKAAPMWS